MIDLSIIIVTYNHQDEINNCLQTMAGAIYSFHSEIFLIDNSSTDHTVSISKKILSNLEKMQHWSIICNETNKGFTRAVNQGLAQSHGEFLLILNPDTEVPTNIFGTLIEIFHKNKEIGIVSPQLRNPNGTLQPSCRRFPRHRDVIYNALGLSWLFSKNKEFNSWKMGDFDHQSQSEVEQPQGAFLLARREAMEQVGLLDEQFPMFFSDVDWCQRFIKKGWKILYVPSVQIIHHKGTSIYRNRLKMIWSSHRSFFYYFRKYYHGYGWKVINLFIGEVLITLAIFRSILYLLISKNMKDYAT
ncbi:glycosyltransferase family 2 protein [candidate division KSB1 bacterium]|nr:glycosyltransferase family 2 protein [candidate division KSB1 bacterium]